MLHVGISVLDKRRSREYKSRAAALPHPYRVAINGIERYLRRTGPHDRDSVVRMLDDLVYMFARAAADAVPMRQLLGDPVDFADDFRRGYGPARSLAKAQTQLRDAVGRAEMLQARPPSSTPMNTRPSVNRNGRSR